MVEVGPLLVHKVRTARWRASVNDGGLVPNNCPVANQTQPLVTRQYTDVAAPAQVQSIARFCSVCQISDDRFNAGTSHTLQSLVVATDLWQQPINRPI